MTDFKRILPTNINFLANKNEKSPLLGVIGSPSRCPITNWYDGGIGNQGSADFKTLLRKIRNFDESDCVKVL